MNGPLPLQPQGPLILEALRLVEGASTLEATLAATPGAELKAILAEVNAQGLLLLLADGRSLTAAGELPYPTGTALTFRIQPQTDGTTQLQPLRADPPAPPALLAPLTQGEAASLLQRLSAPALPPELQPLKALLDRLPAPPPSSPSTPLSKALAPLLEALGLPVPVAEPPAPSTPGDASRTAEPAPPSSSTSTPSASPGPTSTSSAPSLTSTAPPPLAVLTAALESRGIPPEPARVLAQVLLGEPTVAAAPKEKGASASAPPRLPEFAQPLESIEATATFLRASSPTNPATDRALLRAFGLPEPLILALVPPGPEAEAPSHSALAPAAAEASEEPAATLQQVLERLPGPLAQRVLVLLTLLPPSGQGPVLPRQDPLAQLIRSLLPDLQQGRTESPAGRAAALAKPSSADAALLRPSEPATWARWLKEVASTLSRPEASPAEAPFHRLQAREGTALFEMPLPWAPLHNALELWAERDPEGPGRPETHRVLLALNFGRTGELRVALQSGPAGVQAQVVASPEMAARLEPLLREELGEPSPFPVQVRAASELPPRPRALAGSGLQALG